MCSSIMWFTIGIMLFVSNEFSNAFPHKQIKHVSIYDSIPVPAYQKTASSSSFSTSSASASSSSSSSQASTSTSSSSTFTPHGSSQVLEKLVLQPGSFVWIPSHGITKLAEVQNSEGFTSSASASASSSSSTSSATASTSTSGVGSHGASTYVLMNGSPASYGNPTKINLTPTHGYLGEASTSSFASTGSGASAFASTNHLSGNPTKLSPSYVFPYGSDLELENVETIASSNTNKGSAYAATSSTSTGSGTSTATATASSTGSVSSGATYVSTPVKPLKLNPSNVFLYGPSMEVQTLENVASTKINDHGSSSTATASSTTSSATASSSVNAPSTKIKLNPSNQFLFGPTVNLHQVANFADSTVKTTEDTSILNLDAATPHVNAHRDSSVNTAVSSATSESGIQSATSYAVINSPKPKPVQVLNPSNVFLYGPAINFEKVATVSSNDDTAESSAAAISSSGSQTATATSTNHGNMHQGVAFSVASTTGGPQAPTVFPIKYFLNPANPFLYGPAIELIKTANFNENFGQVATSQVHSGSNTASTAQGQYNTGVNRVTYSNDNVSGLGYSGNLAVATAASSGFDGTESQNFAKVQEYHNEETSANSDTASAVNEFDGVHLSQVQQHHNEGGVSESSYFNSDGSGLAFSKVVHGPTFGHGYSGAIASGSNSRVQAASGYAGFGDTGAASASASSASGVVSSVATAGALSASANTGNTLFNYGNNYDHSQDNIQTERHQVVILDRDYNPYERVYEAAPITPQLYGDHEHGYVQAYIPTSGGNQLYFETLGHNVEQSGGKLHNVHEDVSLYRSGEDSIYAIHDHEIGDSDEHEDHEEHEEIDEHGHHNEHIEHDDDDFSSSTYGITFDDFGPRRDNIEEHSVLILKDIAADSYNEESATRSSKTESHKTEESTKINEHHKEIKHTEKAFDLDTNKEDMDVSYETLDFDEGTPLVKTGLGSKTVTSSISSSQSSQSSKSSKKSESSVSSFSNKSKDVHDEKSTSSSNSSSSSSSTSSSSSSSSTKTTKKESSQHTYESAKLV